MNFVKRAFFSTEKKLVRSFILFAVFAIIGTVVLSGSVIKSASEVSKAQALQDIGAAVTMKYDFQNAAAKSIGGMSGKMGETIPISVIDKLSELKYVQDYNYS